MIITTNKNEKQPRRGEMIIKKNGKSKPKLRRSDIRVFQNLNNEKTMSPLRGSIIHMNSLYYNNTTPSGLVE